MQAWEVRNCCTLSPCHFIISKLLGLLSTGCCLSKANNGLQIQDMPVDVASVCAIPPDSGKECVEFSNSRGSGADLILQKNEERRSCTMHSKGTRWGAAVNWELTWNIDISIAICAPESIDLTGRLQNVQTCDQA